VIVRFGDKPISRMRELPRAVAAAKPGEKVALELNRGGKSVTKDVTIAALPEDEARASADVQIPENDQGSTSFGFDIADVPAEIRRQLQLGVGEGALVTNVYSGGPAENEGMRAGDVITEVDRKAVKGGLDAEKKLAEADETTLLLVRRDDATLYVALRRAGK
jgi:serine protease Do